MPDPVEVYREGDLRAELYFEDNPSSPRDCSVLGLIAAGDGRNCPIHSDRGAVPLARAVKFLTGKFNGVALPICAYVHSGATIWIGGRSSGPPGTNCSFDSGFVGVIYADRAAILEWFGRKRLTKNIRREVERLLHAEIDTLDEYLRGEVYRYVVLDVKDNVVDSCGDIPGADYAQSEARRSLQLHAQNEREAQADYAARC